ncbi:hypothetical protein QBC37DRAFT_388289 [Rhypophila decipiens]|uniref:Uncharacterized protein n=1 Tax=Rhypophila decipiens TaxID=261697 RepID=A0AAN6Y6J2_9PEZI|nr:hypothetical protein QBC37DRAFT_388289 [Rhypophila decipiens]
MALPQVPLTVDDVKSVYSDLTAQTQKYGLFGSGRVKNFLAVLAQINPILTSTTASLDKKVTKPLDSSTITSSEDAPYEIYKLHRTLIQEVRKEFRTIKKQSTDIFCTSLGLIPVPSCEIKPGEVRAALVENNDALWDFRYATQEYDLLYGVDIQDDWILLRWVMSRTLSTCTRSLLRLSLSLSPRSEELSEESSRTEDGSWRLG